MARQRVGVDRISATQRTITALTDAEPTSVGAALRLIRTLEGVSLEVFALKLGVPRRNLQDIEAGRRGVSVKRAVQWARLLGYPPQVLVRLTMQRLLDETGFQAKVKVDI